MTQSFENINNNFASAKSAIAELASNTAPVSVVQTVNGLYSAITELIVDEHLEDYLDMIISGNYSELPLVFTSSYSSDIAEIITGGAE